MIWNAVSGAALAAVIVALIMIAVIVVRLVREARATGTVWHKMPLHILLVGTGSAVWGVGLVNVVLDQLGYRALPEWSTAPTALIGALVLHVGLWKMIEVQRLRYRTLGGPGDEVIEEAEPPNLPARNAERISRLFVEMRVLFGLALIGLIFGFSQTATSNNENCVNNNEQDRVLAGLLKVNPARVTTPAERRAKAKFERALAKLEEPQKCPAPGL